MKERPDRIAKGAEIARLNHVHRHDSGWTVESDSNPLAHYEVGLARLSCTCLDFAKHLGICKHMWSTAPALALTILEMREAATVEDLDRLFDEGQERAKDLPRGFELSMRHDYARNFARVEDEVDLSRAAARLNTRAKVAESQAGLAGRIDGWNA